MIKQPNTTEVYFSFALSCRCHYESNWNDSNEYIDWIKQLALAFLCVRCCFFSGLSVCLLFLFFNLKLDYRTLEWDSGLNSQLLDGLGFFSYLSQLPRINCAVRYSFWICIYLLVFFSTNIFLLYLRFVSICPSQEY